MGDQVIFKAFYDITFLYKVKLLIGQNILSLKRPPNAFIRFLPSVPVVDHYGRGRSFDMINIRSGVDC